MKKYFYAGTVVVLLVVAFLAGRGSNRDERTKGRHGEGPAELTQVQKKTDSDSSPVDKESMPPGTVHLNPEKQQSIGVKTGKVESAPMPFLLRTTGRVQADEIRTYRVNAAIDGWIIKVSPVRAGSLVKKNEKLGTFYSPEFIGPEQAYIYALSALDRFKATGKETPTQIEVTNNNIRQYRDSLRNLGMGEAQLAEMAKTRQYSEEIS
jgi:membrane fusion protein, copper/silver efflux system